MKRLHVAGHWQVWRTAGRVESQVHFPPQAAECLKATLPDAASQKHHTTDSFTRHAFAYRKERDPAGEPFFAHRPLNIAHVPHDLPPDTRPGVSPLVGPVANMVANVGRLLACLKESSLAENTLASFSTDNGMCHSRLRGGKAAIEALCSGAARQAGPTWSTTRRPSMTLSGRATGCSWTRPPAL